MFLMKLIKKIWLFSLLFFLVAIVAAGSIEASSLWQSPSGNSMYRDEVAVQEGDILLIVVSEAASARTGSNRERDKEIEVGGSSGQHDDDATFVNSLLSWIPLFGATFRGNSSSSSDRTADMSEALNTRMSVTVEEVAPNGILNLRGEREIKLDDEIKTMRFRGVARSRDVKTDNTIPSDRIANAEIHYESKLGQQEGKPRGLIGRGFVYVKNVLFW